MFEQNLDVLQRAEQIAQTGSPQAVLAELRGLGLYDFGNLLISLPDPAWPSLSRVLPRMAAKEVQESWTGASGSHLFAATCDFVRAVNFQFARICRRPLDRCKILDFGCGYGRMMRMMYYFTDPDNIHGVDPWDKSLEICRQDGVLGNLHLSEYIPASLPLPVEHFDLMFSYSVFSHTSEHVTRQALATLRKYVAPSGMLVLTTRPIEFWYMDSLKSNPEFQSERLLARHREEGFAFQSSNWNRPEGGESIFGDTSIDPNWIARNFPQWRLHGYDRGVDTLQTMIFLTPR